MGRPRGRTRRRVRARLEQGSARVTGSREERVNLAWPDGCTPRSSAESPATAGFSCRWGVGSRGDGKTSPHPGESLAISLTCLVVAQTLGFDPRSDGDLDSGGVRVAAPPAGSSRPGVIVGPTSEFSLFFHVKPGEGASLRGCAPGAAGHARVSAGRLRHGDPDDPRGAVRAVRRRHAAGVHHELRWPVGRVHGGLLHLRADARAVRRHLPPRRGLRRAAGPGGAEGVHPGARSRPRPRTRGTTAAR